MELHELKNTWTVLDEQLKNNGLLNKQIIQEMLHKKSNKALTKLINIDVVCLIGLLILLPYFVWVYNIYGVFLSFKMLSITTMVVILFGIIRSFLKLKLLMKIDFSNSIKETTYVIIKYHNMIKKIKLFVLYILFPLMILLAAVCLYELSVPFISWVLLSVSFTIGVLIFVLKTKVYSTNIKTIKQSLEELDELKKE